MISALSIEDKMAAGAFGRAMSYGRELYHALPTWLVVQPIRILEGLRTGDASGTAP